MLAKRIIPCLDINKGRVVKGTNFVNLKDAGDPVELAKIYDQEGADELVFLDITASSDKRGILIDLVAKVAECLFIPFTVGGGINDIDTITQLLRAGADKVSINSAAISNPGLIKEASQRFGSQCIVVAIDSKKIKTPLPNTASSDIYIDKNSQWEVYTHGGRKPTGIDVVKWASYVESLGAGELLLTSMDHDGTKAGYDIAMTQTISETVRIPTIASGGAGTLDHISSVLKIADAALLASLLHYKEVTVKEIKNNCKQKNIPIRET
ncbi:imidazole glycerol phosphate synthase subunit HisF [Candidatus Marinamargulisbacteria bacterium SCGC AG-414-C22]|nr:imidazole glycerol phosphate synthase subunit HisF [Candidatus Marinamargulisbacteria bacterium SCGC AG-414-C22]